MPVQKGKRRKRQRRRGGRSEEESVQDDTTAEPETTGSRHLRRRGSQMPMWANVLFGVALLGIGTFFTLTPQKGFGPVAHAVILAGYIGLAALYLSKAYRQYRAKTRT